MHSYGENDWITLESFPTVFEAQICSGLLRDASIESVVMDEATGASFSIAIGGIKVRVRSRDYEAARAVLESGPEDHTN